MKKLASILMFILCIALIGCSSKPNVSDIEEDFNRDIGGCFSEVFKLSDLKKTNGIDQGNSYLMVYSYTLEALSNERVFHCTLGENNKLAKWNILPEGTQIGHLETGDKITIVNELIMVKSEKGWIPQFDSEKE